ncbi:MAG: hypothetical protein JO199_02725, partial [Candidatus Eremiobacteraeota bacterium]|nr:hypothetical protein [Candidatus Eremiobacteraeota bacterium]
MLRLATLYALAVVAFDGVAALIARAFDFNYGHFAILCIVFFIGLGLYAGYTLPRRR